MSHSKRNTSRAVFTSYERSLAKSAWNSTSARLSRDSFLPFASCRLCLKSARNPVSCLHGDIFCRECALTNILSQKKEITRLEKVRKREEREAEEDRDRNEDQARELSVKEFERVQMGLEAKVGGAARGREIVGRENGKIIFEEDGVGGKRGEKRKFELDEDELLRISREDRTKARKAIDDEKASKTTLPSFWVPSVTPSSNTTTPLHTLTKAPKSTPLCPSSPADSPHPYSLHTLIPLLFSEEEDATNTTTNARTKTTQRICPSCKKTLSNTSKAQLAIPCGHVLCGSCVAQFMTPSGVRDPHAPPGAYQLACFVCGEDLTDMKEGRDGKGGKEKEKIKPGLVGIRSEGTGFAGGGQNTVEKNGVAFQC